MGIASRRQYRYAVQDGAPVQLINPTDTTSSSLTFTKNANGSVTIVGTSTVSMNRVYSVSITSGHKYFIAENSLQNKWSVVYGTWYRESATYKNNGRIVTASTTETINAGIHLADLSYTMNETIYFLFIDLTAMYGEGNEPTTVEEFRKDYPLDYYAYNVTGDGALIIPKSVPCYLPSKANACYEAANGSPIFYGKCYQDGTPSPSAPVTVQYVDGDGRIGVQNVLTKVNTFPSTNRGLTASYNNDGSYTVTGTPNGDGNYFTNINYVAGTTSGFTVGHKYAVLGNKPNLYVVTSGVTYNGAEVGYTTGLSDRIITCGNFLVYNARWARLQVPDSVTTYINETIRPMIIDLTAMYGEGNEPSTVAEFKAMYPEDYYAYNYGQTLTIPDLYGIGDVRDTYEPCVMVDGVLRSRLIRRIGVVDLGTLDYVRQTSYTNPIFPTPRLSTAKANSANVMSSCLRFTSSNWNLMEDNSVAIGGNCIAVRCDMCTDADAFKDAMSGVLLYYELATPVTTLGNPQPVQSYGGTTNIFHTSTVQPKIGATVVTHS